MYRSYICIYFLLCAAAFGSCAFSDPVCNIGWCCFSREKATKKMRLERSTVDSSISSSHLTKATISFGVIDSNLTKLQHNIKSKKFSGCTGLITTIKDQLDLMFARGSVSQEIQSEVHIIKHVLAGIQYGLAGDLDNRLITESMENGLKDLCKRIAKVRGGSTLALTPSKKESLLDTANRAYSMCFCEAQESGVSLCIDVPDTFKRFRLTMPEHSLETVGVLYNLLINTIKYRSKTSPKVTLSLRIDNDSSVLFGVFCIEDNGIGMTEATLANIFTVGFRAKETQHIPGSGIGLNSCKIALEKMGGKIEVTSKLGQGTTFTVKVPCESFGKTIQRRRIERAAFRVGTADDNEIMCKLIAQYARKNKIFCKCFETCEQLRDDHIKQPYHLLLLDEAINGFRNGTEIAAEILALHTQYANVEPQSSVGSNDLLFSQVPTPIMISISGTQLDDDFLQKYGISSCLTKPFDKNDFEVLISRYFDLI